MTDRLNVLVSSSRQWNCGDEFILQGIRRLFRASVNREINWLLYDRNPDVLGKTRVLGNSWRGEPIDRMDWVVIAGTPEWSGESLRPLLEKTNPKRLLYLGIGSCSRKLALSELDIRCLRGSPLVVCRDKILAEGLMANGVQAEVLPCPALFAAGTYPVKTVKAPKNIGFVFQTNRTNNQNLYGKEVRDSLALMGRLSKRYSVVTICHYKDEYLYALDHGFRVKYSLDSHDYADLYADLDAVVSTRVHGTTMAISCGVPALMINGSLRATGTCMEFPGTICRIEEVEKRLDGMDVAETSRDWLAFKGRVRAKYLERLSATVCLMP